MHEWALAESVVLTAEKAAKEQGFKEIKEVIVKLGELQQLDKEILEFAIREVIVPRKTLFNNAKIEFQIEKAVLKCRNCGLEWPFDESVKKLNSTESEAIHFIPEVSHAYVRCPQCKSPDFEVVRGRGIRIDSIAGETEC